MKTSAMRRLLQRRREFRSETAMAEDSSPSSSSSSAHRVEIKTTLLYGVFASHKSYLIGVRNLMKREHADMLCNKIMGKMLPPELIEIVADYLFEMEREVVMEKWVSERRAMQENISRFEKVIVDCPALGGARERMATSPIKTTLVQNSRPITGQNIRLLDPDTTTYIHLCCTRPSLAINLPPRMQAPTPISSAIVYHAGKAKLVVRLRGNDDSRGVVHEDQVTHMPDKGREAFQEVPKQIHRLVQCEGVEDAMKNWDADEIQKFVDLLDLTIVPFGGGDPMAPGLHSWQRVFER
ncbi:hypothetical protein PRZ48_012736 [Zasmidium cellare]|uniref:Uncharacterized protein n=1 Tax=Zasmidium cellare TaxID=395010 RepID=A0ABR0E6N3_ZASCE|nr:hypothetical protein PRZ48_012736 [Zasmidium cellare]